MSSVYFLHAYAGPRLGGDHPDYMQDRSLYLRTHLDQLSKLQNNVDHVVISVNNYMSEPQEFSDIINVAENQGIEIYRRTNIGVSYGAWSELIDIYHNDFDYFFFMEDDYLYVKDNFDKIMIDMFNEHDDTAFLCGLIGTGHGGGDRVHAGSSNGVTSREILKECLKYGKFPFSNMQHDYHNNSFGQVKWSQHFLNAGAIRDITHKYAVPFAYYGTVRWYFCVENDYNTLQVPYQYFRDEINVS